MAHAPEMPEKYVCTACQMIHAGTVSKRTESGHEYEAPAECGCCGESELVPEKNWPHFQP
ncbi:hypothetical protein [Natrinema pallidum]|uniref:Small CPxCG-related zinc finger protein n=1 Tax=Natrinema pallidum DSM 3751 TaxID=1227495 RepID=L9Z567_9EURY|nr:hypothetical protein [Natrinema pallidum]ELY81504.1 hypothetical protein C487_03118 [Natrinema pallidum DSM 3751]